MAWSAPRTWVTGETLTSTLLNSHLRDQLIALGGAIGTAYAPAAINTDLAAPTNQMHPITPTGAGFSVRSIAAPGSAGQRLVLRNTSASAIQLLHQTAGGTGVQLFNRSQGTVTLGQYQSIEYIYDGTNWNEIDLNLGVSTFRSSTLLDLNTSSALTSVISQAIGAGILSASSVINFELGGDILDNTGANQGSRILIAFGGTTLFDATEGSLLAASAIRAAWSIRGRVKFLSATSCELTGALLIGGGRFTAPTVGLGSASGADAIEAAFASNGAVTVPDATVGQTFLFQWANTSALATMSTRFYGWQLEVI